MENASKALIMAGAVLIAMIIVSLSIFTFNKMGDKVKDKTDMTEEEIKMFNSKITPYLGKQSGTQVNVLIQYIISNNISVAQSGSMDKSITITFQYDSDSSHTNTIKVIKNGSKLEVNYGTGAGAGKKRVETGSGKFYNVNVTSYGDNGLIEEIIVTKI